MNELELLTEADRRARDYVSGASNRPVFPGTDAVAALADFNEPLPEKGRPGEETLALMDTIGSPATVASNGPNYFGFVIGASLPAASAAERLALAWDQCASTYDGSPAAFALEKQAANWVLECLDLPRGSAVGFGTSATACGLSCFAAARSALLAKKGWSFEDDGLAGAPPIRAVVPETTHVTVKKALRILGFGLKQITYVPTDEHGRVIPDAVPELDDCTLLCLQAGEVNTGEFDPFNDIIPKAKAAGTWVHVDGAFGLWARAAEGKRHLTEGLGLADSWTTDGHKWLNTPYDGAIAICRDPAALARAMNSDAAYSSASADAQKNLTLEFSRRARGIPVWAALRSLGREGVSELVERHCRFASRIGIALRDIGYDVQNRVVLNQVLVRAATDEKTTAVLTVAQNTGEVWFGPTVWNGRPAFRISVSSWRTQDTHIDKLIDVMRRLHDEIC